MRRALGHGDNEGTRGKAFVSVGAGGEEGFGDEACVGDRDKARRAPASDSGPGTRRLPMLGLGHLVRHAGSNCALTRGKAGVLAKLA